MKAGWKGPGLVGFCVWIFWVVPFKLHSATKSNFSHYSSFVFIISVSVSFYFFCGKTGKANRAAHFGILKSTLINRLQFISSKTIEYFCMSKCCRFGLIRLYKQNSIKMIKKCNILRMNIYKNSTLYLALPKSKLTFYKLHRNLSYWPIFGKFILLLSRYDVYFVCSGYSCAIYILHLWFSSSHERTYFSSYLS